MYLNDMYETFNCVNPYYLPFVSPFGRVTPCAPCAASSHVSETVEERLFVCLKKTSLGMVAKYSFTSKFA